MGEGGVVKDKEKVPFFVLHVKKPRKIYYAYKTYYEKIAKFPSFVVMLPAIWNPGF